MPHPLDRDLPSEEGFGAHWDQVAGVIILKADDGSMFMLTPNEIQRVASWIKMHDLK